MGIGRRRIITSVRRFEMPLAREKAIRSKHFGFLMLLSQKADTGTHSNIPAKKRAAHQAKTMAPAM